MDWNPLTRIGCSGVYPLQPGDITMKIVDYQTGKELRDVSLLLNDEELEEFALYITRLRSDRRLNCAHLTQVSGARLERELTVALIDRVGVL